MRARITVIVAALVLVLSVADASAITNGQSDETRHPYVGLMEGLDEHGVPIQVCSGSLLSSTTYLTAGHCVEAPAARVEIFMEKGPIQIDLDYLIALFFDPTFDGSCYASPKFDGYPCKGDGGGTPHPHPDFCTTCKNGLLNDIYRDVGVVTLDAPVPSAKVDRYAQLAPAGHVDTLSNKTATDFVGYGVQSQVQFQGAFSPHPPPYFRWVGAGERMYAPSELVSGNFASSDEFMRFALNASKGSGGLCFGDSGGPDLLSGTDTVLAVNSQVTNWNCAGVGYSQRVDVPAVRNWILSLMR